MTIPILTTVAEMSAWSDAEHRAGRRIAFVPTMGALHAGHVALLQDARKRGDRLVLSIFVNPTQFGPQEDFNRYPRDLQADLTTAAPANVDLAFAPTPAEMYPTGHQTTVQVHDIEQGLCGDFRPGHFVGVATVVCKFFNIVRPDVAVFGEKDFQQLAVIQRMVADLNMPVTVLGMPTVREADGLALSSRNRYLDADQRRRAVSLSAALRTTHEAVEAGEHDVTRLLTRAGEIIGSQVDRVEYIDIRDSEWLRPLTTVDRPAVMAIAAYIGNTRLIDNIRLR